MLLFTLTVYELERKLLITDLCSTILEDFSDFYFFEESFDSFEFLCFGTS